MISSSILKFSFLYSCEIYNNSQFLKWDLIWSIFYILNIILLYVQLPCLEFLSSLNQEFLQILNYNRLNFLQLIFQAYLHLLQEECIQEFLSINAGWQRSLRQHIYFLKKIFHILPPLILFSIVLWIFF